MVSFRGNRTGESKVSDIGVYDHTAASLIGSLQALSSPNHLLKEWRQLGDNIKVGETVTLSSEGAIPGALSIETTLSWGKLPGTMNLAATVVMRSPADDENVAGVDAAELFSSSAPATSPLPHLPLQDPGPVRKT